MVDELDIAETPVAMGPAAAAARANALARQQLDGSPGRAPPRRHGRWGGAHAAIETRNVSNATTRDERNDNLETLHWMGVLIGDSWTLL